LKLRHATVEEHRAGKERTDKLRRRAASPAFFVRYVNL
jgi:hypothetical protein